jgi:hypothetical protein
MGRIGGPFPDPANSRPDTKAQKCPGYIICQVLAGRGAADRAGPFYVSISIKVRAKQQAQLGVGELRPERRKVFVACSGARQVPEQQGQRCGRDLVIFGVPAREGNPQRGKRIFKPLLNFRGEIGPYEVTTLALAVSFGEVVADQSQKIT